MDYYTRLQGDPERSFMVHLCPRGRIRSIRAALKQLLQFFMTANSCKAQMYLKA